MNNTKTYKTLREAGIYCPFYCLISLLHVDNENKEIEFVVVIPFPRDDLVMKKDGLIYKMSKKEIMRKYDRVGYISNIGEDFEFPDKE